jgi:hypothetical protein
MSMKPYWVWSDGPLQLQRKTLDSLNSIAGGGGGGGTLVRLVTVPASSSDPGTVGDFAEDDEYLYVYTGAGWTRTPINDWS